MLTITKYAHDILDELPESVRDCAILAGGALRAFFDGSAVKDYDLFFRSNDEYQFALRALSESEMFAPIQSHFAARQFRHLDTDHIFNLIGFYFDDPVHHAHAFDFRCCQLVAWMANGCIMFYAEPGAICDAETRTLTIVNNNGEERTLLRVTYYMEKYGYTPSDDEGPIDSPVVHAERIRRAVRLLPVAARGY